MSIGSLEIVMFRFFYIVGGFKLDLSFKVFFWLFVFSSVSFFLGLSFNVRYFLIREGFRVENLKLSVFYKIIVGMECRFMRCFTVG